MRSAPITFSAVDESSEKSPRFVIAIIYDVDSLYITSHAGIANVPGTVIEGALAEPNIVSQRLKPDEAAAEIGSASFALIDLEGMFTGEIRERLNDGAGLRGRQVRFYLGYEELAFEDFQLIGTQIVNGASYADGKYSVQCLDIQRALRSEVFELQATTLGATVLVDDTTITLTSTSGLHRVQHGPSYSDAPNERVGYIKIKSEVIRYANIAGNQLTGCVRGVFNTTPAQYTVDPATPADRREKVSEYVYLELPAIKLAYAILTGSLHGSLNTLPPKWHLGISPDLITFDDFYNIGRDLWHPGDDAAGFVVRFEGLTKQDGKRFLEKEIYLLTGVYSPVYADGTLGLRRATAVREDAATVLTLDDSNSVQVGELVHDMNAVHNAFVVNWSWNGEEFRRATAYVDTQSRQKHGAAETYTLNFKGLHGGRHTDGIVFQMLDMIRDRYAGPPVRVTVDILHRYNKIEVGDIVRGRWSHVRDFSGKTFSIDRAFEVQNVSVNHRAGKVSVELFGSTAEATEYAPTRAPVSLPNSFYTSAGTALASVSGLTIANGILSAASVVLIGSDDLNASASIFYFDGDLTIANGVTLNIAANVQLRVRGFLQINGAIVGRGRGHAGVADDGRALAYPAQVSGDGPVPADTIPGVIGFVGNTRGYDGVRTRAAVLGNYILGTWPAHLTQSAHTVAPRLLLAAQGNTLNGLPQDIRGGGGGPGGRVGNSSTLPYPPDIRGGTGGSGGAGLAIVCRGMAFGASGQIDLSGSDSSPTPLHSVTVSGEALQRYPGAGAGGGPGALYVLLDGSGFSIPDFSGNKFRAVAGAAWVPNANSLGQRRSNHWAPSTWSSSGTMPRVYSPLRGFDDPDFRSLDARDYSGSALVVQHVPGDEIPVADEIARPDPPVGLVTESVEQGINVSLAFINYDWDSVQLFASIDNNRANAVKVAEGKFDWFRLRVPDGATRRFWARTKSATGFSHWFPADETAGVLGSALGGLIARGGAEAYGTGARKPDSVGVGWNADVYSAETYSGGAFVSFQPATLGRSLMVGLNSDPETDQYQTSLDFAWHVRADNTLDISESGAVVSGFGAYTTSTVLAIKYDGQQVQYFKDGGLVRSVARVGASFFVDSSFETPGGAIKNLKYGPLTTAPSIPYIARGNCAVTASTIRKAGGVAAWDSDAYSFEAYRRGAFVSFQSDQTNAQLMVGLNVDPTTDQSAASLDFAIYLHSDGNAHAYESNVSAASLGAYTTSTVFAIAYDGRTVRYLKDGALVREVYAPDRTFYLDASFYSPDASIRKLTFTPFGTATPVPFLARGQCVVSDTGAQKVGGVAAWDSDFVSINGYPLAFIEFKPNQANTSLMAGLNSDPYTDQSYVSLDAAWYPASDGIAYIYESGANVGAFGAYSPSTVFAITYDGADFRYYMDGAHIRTTAAPGLTVFADGAFHLPGAAINSLRFGPGSSYSLIDTAQIRPSAIAQTYEYAHSPPFVASSFASDPLDLAQIDFGLKEAATVQVSFLLDVNAVRTTPASIGFQITAPTKPTATGVMGSFVTYPEAETNVNLAASKLLQPYVDEYRLRAFATFKSPFSYDFDAANLKLTLTIFKR